MKVYEVDATFNRK